MTLFARQADLPLLYRNEDLENIRINGFEGEYTVEEALELLLKDTGISGSINRRGVLTISAVEKPSGDTESVIAGGFVEKLAEFLLGKPDKELADQRSELNEGETKEQGKDLEEITVTGSRIARSGMSAPTPITTVSRNELLKMAPTTVIDAMVQLPQFVNSDTPYSQNYSSTGHAGASRVNLRGIGTQRTLILLDGRRLVPSTRTGEVNVALLPEALIKNVDIVTGGASAAYGSDAVSGVVNFILDTNYDGFSGYAEGGITGLGDNQSREAGLVLGSSIQDSVHILISGEYYQADGIEGYYDRDWFNSWAAIENPDPLGPAEVIVPNVHSRRYTYGGLITGGPLKGIQFDDNGRPVFFEDGKYVTGNTQVEGSGTDPGEDIYILPDQKRVNGFTNINFSLNEDTLIFLQGIYARSETGFEKIPSLFTPPWEATIYIDNAFLPESLRSQMTVAGVSSFPFGRIASDDDLGAGHVINTNDMLTITTGVNGRLRETQYKAYYQYGRNTARLHYSNTARIDRLYKALDAIIDPSSGNIICRSTLTSPDDGCVPVNMFGRGSPSPVAVDWITEGYAEQKQIIEQHFSELILQRDFKTSWAGQLNLMAGAAFRAESFDNQPLTDPPELLNQVVRPAELEGYRGLPDAYEYSDGLFERTAARGSAGIRGSYNVWEVFGETIIPVYASEESTRKLDLNMAARYADYQGSGGVLVWKTGAEFWVGNGLKLRLNGSRDVRAGTLAERFDHSIRGNVINDPRASADEAVYAIRQLLGGNPNVSPEKADTLTFGIVYRPAWLEGLSISADYYDIQVNGAIARPGPQYIIDQCYSGLVSFCSLIHRNPVTGLITTVEDIYQNIDEARTRGIDIEADYQTPVNIIGGQETLSFRGFATIISEASVTNAGSSKIDRAGQTGIAGGSPHWQWNFSAGYRNGPFSLYIQERFIDSGSYYATWDTSDISDNSVDAAYYTNLQLAYDMALANSNITLFGHVSNLFDADPPLAPDWRFGGTFHTNEYLFDVLGRRFSIGMRFSF